jgi:hypothetical protein
MTGAAQMNVGTSPSVGASSFCRLLVLTRRRAAAQMEFATSAALFRAQRSE